MSPRIVLTTLVAVLGLAAALVPAGVSAQAPEPQIVFSGNGTAIANGDSTPETLDGTDFGATPEGVAIPHIFVIGNTGDADLTVTDVSVPAGFSFSAPAGLPGTVSPSGAMLLIVTCDAKSADTYTGFVSIASNDPDEDRAGFSIACRVNGRPEIDVTGNGTPITSGDTTPTTTDATEFGSTLLNLPVTHTFRVSNRGAADLTIGAVSLPTGFTALTTLPATIPPSQTAELQVRCNATAEGTYTGNVSIVNNDQDENPFLFRIHCVVGDDEPAFNPGPGDLPPATTTAVSSPVTITTPPPDSGSLNDDGATSGTGSNGSQSGGSQANAGAATPTATPPRPTATAIVPTRAAGSTQSIFSPPSTGEGAAAASDGGLPSWALVAAAGALVAALAGGLRLRARR